ncbi:MAG: hypothetical protein EP300_09615 [Gammaproteobacteria bacterium]|nr:MAG: hypothetical protein EP300_09615 [Gammaproteobacteria bacterium]
MGSCASPGDPSFDGKGDLEADNFDDVGLGFNVGFTFEASNVTTVGVHYRSKVDIDVDGDADFKTPSDPNLAGFLATTGLFADTGLGAKVTLPASLSFSVAHKRDKFIWLADFTWVGWSAFDELRIEYDNPAQPDTVTTEDWDDSWRYSAGFDYLYSDSLVLRAGVCLR